MSDAGASALRARFRHALARDLNLPELRPTVTVTSGTPAVIARRRVDTATTPAAPATLDAGARVGARASALAAR